VLLKKRSTPTFKPLGREVIRVFDKSRSPPIFKPWEKEVIGVFDR